MPFDASAVVFAEQQRIASRPLPGMIVLLLVARSGDPACTSTVGKAGPHESPVYAENPGPSEGS